MGPSGAVPCARRGRVRLGAGRGSALGGSPGGDRAWLAQGGSGGAFGITESEVRVRTGPTGVARLRGRVEPHAGGPLAGDGTRRAGQLLFPGSKFQSHLTVLLRRLFDIKKDISKWEIYLSSVNRLISCTETLTIEPK